MLGGGMVAGYAAKELVVRGLRSEEVMIVSADDALSYAYRAALYRTYANWLLTSIAAAFRTSALFPITSAGHSGQPWQESFVATGFITGSIAVIATSILVLGGPRRTAAEANDSWKHSEFNVPRERKDADHEAGDHFETICPIILVSHEVAEPILLMASD